jgi:hypothetical protein
MKKEPDDPLPLPLRYLFVSPAAEKTLETRRQSKMAFVGELLAFLFKRWPTEASLTKSGRTVANCSGPVGEHLKFVVEPQLRAVAVFSPEETEPTTAKIRSLIAKDVAVKSPFV